MKSRRVTGDTDGQYHPHGDSAIYDALVRMAQPFSLRHPLIDFHGNYGSPDFGPAAARYTECRLHPLAMQLLADIDEEHRRHAADLRRQPRGARRCCPSRFPNLLVNGSQGIAVGMATNIPPHNLGEVIDATLHLIDHPDATPDDLMQLRQGPRLPDGRSASSAGPGSWTPTAPAAAASRCEPRRPIEETASAAQMQIVVTELPYQTSCAAIAGRIQELVDAGEPRWHRRCQRQLGRRQDQPGHHACSATPTPTSC